MKFDPYQKYKPSEMDWLNSVPEHWSVFPLKRSVQAVKGGVWGEEPQGDDNDLVCIRVADFDRVKLIVCTDRLTVRNISPSEKNGRALAFGDLLLEKSGGGENQPVGCVVRYEQSIPAVCSNFIARLSPSEGARSSYFKYVHTVAYSLRLTVRSINQTSGIQNLDTDKYLAERVPYPPVHEQLEIASFLDRETAKIDTLISKQEKLIELLREKRQAVISHAVTKGLDPSAPIQPSGVEWIGNRPAHWETIRIKWVARMESGHTPDKKIEAYWTNCDIPWVSLNDTGYLKDHDYITDTAYQINELGIANSSARLLPERVVVFSRDATIGRCAITTRPMAVSQHFIAWVCGERVLPEYLLFALRSMQQELERLTFGATLKTIGMPDVKTLTMPLPPIEEQAVVVKHIRNRTTKIDELIAKAEKAIALQREHRTALISAAVTGKIDVREAASELQEAA